MVVFPRKKNESLVIGDSIFVTVIEICDDKVRLGIECPKEMTVHRREAFASLHQAASQDEPR